MKLLRIMVVEFLLRLAITVIPEDSDEAQLMANACHLYISKVIHRVI